MGTGRRDMSLLLYVFSLILVHRVGIGGTGIAMADDLGSDRAALLAIRSAVGGRSMLWNLKESSPCSWAGVVCQRDRVAELHLPGVGLSGQLPSGAIGNLTRLTTLSLRSNALSGTLPADIASCSELRYLYLQGNFFSGQIPPAIFSLTNLIRLSLAANGFSGEIPPGFAKLTRLGALYLEKNRLTGSIPDLNWSNLIQFNVSNNRLSGSVPSSLSKMPATSFDGNSLCGSPLSPCSSTTGGGGGSSSKLSGGAIAGIVIGSLLGLFIILAILVTLYRRRKKSGRTSPKDNIPTPQQKSFPNEEIPVGQKSGTNLHEGDHAFSGGGSGAAVSGRKGGSKVGGSKDFVFFGDADKVFDLESLLRASAEVLGKGTFGTAYKANLDMSGMVVAVKRLKDVIVPEREFREKMETLGRMEHENLVPLRAYFYTPDEKLLVFDYKPMGSLSALLHGNRGSGRTPLNWETRSNIALGAARGIAYLHSRTPTTSHGNIKSSNILLTNSYEACVSDFGLACVAGVASAPNRVSGYRAPEVTDSRKVSQKADVYSFGVLLLELLTGKAPSHALLNEEGVDLPRWVQSVVREEWTSEVFDLELLRYQNVEEEMVQLLQLAVDCATQYPDTRPSMAEATARIEEICRASLKHMQQDPRRDFLNDSNGWSSRQAHSVDVEAAPPVV